MACSCGFGRESKFDLGRAWGPSRFSPRFSYFHEPNPGLALNRKGTAFRRWALCALRTPRRQAERALHCTCQKAAVRASFLVCATSRGCRWVVSSAHPAREAAGPLALVPRLPPHPRHLAGACCSHIRPKCTRIHTGPLGTAGLLLFVASCRFACAPLSHAPRLLAPAEPRFGGGMVI